MNNVHKGLALWSHKQQRAEGRKRSYKRRLSAREVITVPSHFHEQATETQGRGTLELSSSKATVIFNLPVGANGVKHVGCLGLEAALNVVLRFASLRPLLYVSAIPFDASAL